MTSRIVKIVIVVLIIVVIIIGVLFALAIMKGKSSSQGQSSGGIFGTIFSLFNGGPEGTASSSPTATIQSDSGAMVTIPRLRQVTKAPVAGAGFIQRVVASTTVDNQGQVKNVSLVQTFIRYVDRATSHFFETKPDSLDVAEITNTTLPKIYQALITNQGNSALLRYLGSDENTIETSYVLVSTSTATTTTVGGNSGPKSLFTYALPENITELALSPGRDQIFYLRAGGQGGIGSVASPNNAKPKQIFNFPLKEWQVSWPKTNTLTLTTRPSAYIPGYVFFMNSTTGSLTKVLGNVPGLTTLTSPDLSYILFNESNTVDFDLNLFNTKSGSASSLSLKTLPEKCVWSQKATTVVYCAVPILVKKGNYPDVWYQGSVFFNDNFWKINVQTGERTVVARTADLTKQAIDAVNLSLDPNENYLMFTNKRDLTLWNLLITQPPGPIVSSSTPATTGPVVAPTSTPYTPPAH